MVFNILLLIVGVIAIRYAVGGALKTNTYNMYIGIGLILGNVILSVIVLCT